MRVLLVVISIGLILTQLGCATSSGNPPYPTGWASIKSVPRQDSCPDLQGTYANRGTATFPPEAGEPPFLTDIFEAMAHAKGSTGPTAWEQSWPAIPRDASSVAIEQTPETMTVTFIDSIDRRTSLNFRRYQFTLSEDRVDDMFSCRTLYDEPTLRFFAEPESHVSATQLWIAGGGTFVNLMKSVDGSLVVNLKRDTVALTLFVLGTGYQVDNLWYRYAQSVGKKPAEW